jgi:hypothetical protein
MRCFIHYFSIQTRPLVTHYFGPFAEWRHELSGMSQHLYQCLTVACPSSDDRCSPSCRSISSSNRQGKATSRRGIQTRVVIPGEHIVVPSFSNLVAYQVGTSRYQLREKPRQSQRSLKVATMRVPVRTAHPEIASGGTAQTQCPTRRRIRNTPGPWMRAHLQDTLVVEIGMPLSPVPFVIELIESKPQLPSENLLAIDAPTTTKCDMCQVYFCGIGVQHRCVAVRLSSAHPHGMSDIGDLIQSTEVYECFDGNAVEVEIMLDYLGTQHISPRHIYGEVSVSRLTSEIFSPLLTHH